MSVTPEEVKKIAYLARLHLDDSEAGKMAGDMNAILAYVEKLSEVDTEGVSELAWYEGKRTPAQPDVVQRFEHVAEAMQNAPQSEGNFFIVPKVIE